MVLVVFLMPQGIAGLFDQIRTRYAEFRRGKVPENAA
jgi:hypothetical protein